MSNTSGAKVAPLLWSDMPMKQTKPKLHQTAFKGDNVLLVMNVLDADFPVNMHSHPFEQITQVLEGTVNFHNGDEVIPGEAGSIIRFPPGVVHATAPTGGKPVRILDIFSPIREDYLHLAEHQNG